VTVDRSHAIGGFAALVLALSVFGIEPSGDCGEYLLMARAFAAHATPDIRVEDAIWVSEHEPRLRDLLSPLLMGIPADEPVLLSSIFHAPNGSHYSLHFWFYSLLCVPFLWLTSAVGAYPIVACALVNACATIVAGAYLQRSLSPSWLGKASPYLFLLAGTTYYLGWTGPETLTAAAVVVSVVAAVTRDAGLASLAAGAAATQNPSTAALIPFAASAWVLLRVRPGLSLSAEAVARPLDRRTWILAASGVALVLLPYAFFLAVFGKPSLIGEHATSSALIGWERAWSLVFDLNQGMLIGVPGVLIGLLIALVGALRARGSRRAPLLWSAATLAVTGVLIVPALAPHNWNSGASVLMRYAYWSSMPLLALVLLLTARLPRRLRWVVAGGVLCVQLPLLLVNGIWGERSRYTEHSWAANFVLRRWPGAYNPVPEIFHERTVKKEAPPLPGLVVEWPKKGRPKKLLAFPPGPVRSKRLCRGRFVVSRNEVPASGGARYLNPPLRCVGPKPRP
jgi:hypothetical protein